MEFLIVFTAWVVFSVLTVGFLAVAIFAGMRLFGIKKPTRHSRFIPGMGWKQI